MLHDAAEFSIFGLPSLGDNMKARRKGVSDPVHGLNVNGGFEVGELFLDLWNLFSFLSPVLSCRRYYTTVVSSTTAKGPFDNARTSK